MNIKIHRGTHQIGGCVTEYEYDGWRLFVDYGEELPGGPKSGDLQIEGLTHGDISKSALLITHYHGDHIGNITKLPKDLPIYMGRVARDIQLVLSNHLKYKYPVHKDMVERLQNVRTFEAGQDFMFGKFEIKPVTVDHSAFDAYAFRIKVNGTSAYHTGDFRLHGFRSGSFLKMLEQYVGKVDYVVCEATNILRPNATSKKESALQRDFVALFKEKKSTVVYLSSTNIDRLFSLYHAALKAGRPFYVDGYQKHMMDVVVNSKSLWTKSTLYQYGKYEPEPLMYHRFDKNRFFVSDSFKAYLDKLGYVLIARNNERFDNLLEQIPGEQCAAKFLQADALLYPETVVKDLPLYGNQFIPLGIKTTMVERIRIASLFDSYCNGGSIAHLNIDAPFDSFEKAWDAVNYIADQGLTYFAFNTKIQACEHNHAFYGKKCPVCGGDVATEYTRIVGFYTPIKTWSKERKAEFELRQWEHMT